MLKHSKISEYKIKEITEGQQAVLEKVDEILVQSLIEWFEEEGEAVIAFCEEKAKKRHESVQRDPIGGDHPSLSRFSAGLDFFLQKGKKEDVCRILEKYADMLSDHEVQASVRNFLNYEDSIDEGIAYMKKYIKQFVDEPGGGSYILRDDTKKVPPKKRFEFQEIAGLAIENAGESNDTGISTMLRTDWNDVLDWGKLADKYLDELIEKTRCSWGMDAVIDGLVKKGEIEKAIEVFGRALKSKSAEKFKREGLSHAKGIYEKANEDERVLLELTLGDAGIPCSVSGKKLVLS